MAQEMIVKMLADECWWGGCIVDAEKMPFDARTEYSINLYEKRITQTAPLFLSNKGRYLWSEEPFCIAFHQGTMTITENRGEMVLDKGGDTLRDAYRAARDRFFPFEKNIHIRREFFEHPQFNTWMELIKDQNERDILAYAQEIVDNGYTPGVLMIDGGWQKCQGTWEFDPDKFTDPKALFAKLHQLGFKVMIWISPFICSEGENFLEMYSTRSSEAKGGALNTQYMVRRKDGEVAIQKWWSGFGAIHNFTSPEDCARMDQQLEKLMSYGIDGFKCDGGSYRPSSFLTGCDFYGGVTCEQLNNAWMLYAAKRPFHEVKDSWKMGGKPIVQRLFDKRHTWQDNGLDCLVPHGIFTGLIGCPFVCPDMVGGGEWTNFVYGTFDEELFVRMAEASALFPMMQFSSLPWRHLSKEAVQICQDMAKLHERMYPYIESVLTQCEQEGEPMIRSMEYQYPGQGYAFLRDQYMLGERVLVAPVMVKGQTQRTVCFPEGTWESEAGERYVGPAKVMVPAPLSRLPWFTRVD